MEKQVVKAFEDECIEINISVHALGLYRISNSILH